MGPVQAKEHPATLAAEVRLIVAPVHTGELLPMDVIDGVWSTTTVVEALAEVQPFCVLVTM